MKFHAMFSSQNFIVLTLSFRSMTHCELVFQHGMEQESKLTFLHIGILLYQNDLLEKNSPFLAELPWHLCQKSIDNKPWMGISVGQCNIPTCQGLIPGQSTYKNQPMNAYVSGKTNQHFSPWSEKDISRKPGERLVWLVCLRGFERGPVNQRVTGLIPSQGTCLGCEPGPQLGVCKRQPHIDVSLLLFFLPFFSV